MSHWTCALHGPAALVTLVALALPAHGATILNGSFENVGGATTSFSIDNPTSLPNWTAHAGTPTANQVLDCLVYFSGANATTPLCAGNVNGWTLDFWVNPGKSPDGGNYVAMDGVGIYETPLTQTVTGLTVGVDYAISFYQAAAQQSGFDGATTEQWQVSLGPDTQNSAIMYNANHSDVPWFKQTLVFTAKGANQLLSFIALGTPGGQPPFVLLDGISITQTPEPASFMLIGVGLAGIPLARKLLKKKQS